MNRKKSIVYLSRYQLEPHPDNPRKDLGDLTELRESIRQNGIMQNLTVIPTDDTLEHYLIQKYPININYFTGTESGKKDICESCYKRIEVTFREIAKAYGRKYR